MLVVHNDGMVKTADVSEEFVIALFRIHPKIEGHRNLYHFAPMWKAVGATVNVECRETFLYQTFRFMQQILTTRSHIMK
jgi:hypothetical protein